MSTNEAFIRAYRNDPPRRAAPSSQSASRVWQPASTPALPGWETSVEIVAAGYAPATPPQTAIERPKRATAASPPQRAIGKRPLSSFAVENAIDPHSAAEPSFLPETTISAFRWPQVCRALWERYADEYERVAELLQARCHREPGRGGLIGVCGLHGGDGCTTTLLCLAVAIAAGKTPVILVDANFRAPRLAGLLGVQPATTWQDILEQGLPVAEAVIHAAHDRVDLLPLDVREPSGREPNGAKLATGLQTSITAGVLRYAYDVVLVDLGAILAPRSFATMSHLIRNMRIDAAIAVADPKHAEPDDLTIAGELLDEAGCELLGVIENRANCDPNRG